jgi:acetoacetyl-CoA synthetase
MDVIAVSPEGEPVVGKEGTMVFRTAFPNMPTGFVGDEDRSLLKKTYFEDFRQPYFNMNDSILINPRTKGL